MQFVTISLPENPTEEQLRKAHDVLACLGDVAPAPKELQWASHDDLMPVSMRIPADGSLAHSAAEAFTPGVKLDARGFPWDARIHSGSKAVNADGSWKKLKNVTPATTVAVEAELTRLMGNPAPTPAPDAPPPPADAVPPPPPPLAVADTAPPVVAAAPFPALMKDLSPLLAGGKLTPAKLGELCKTAGAASLPELASRPDLIPTVRALLMGEGFTF